MWENFLEFDQAGPVGILKFPAQGSHRICRQKMRPAAASILERARGSGARRARHPGGAVYDMHVPSVISGGEEEASCPPRIPLLGPHDSSDPVPLLGSNLSVRTQRGCGGSGGELDLHPPKELYKFQLSLAQPLTQMEESHLLEGSPTNPPSAGHACPQPTPESGAPDGERDTKEHVPSV